MAIAGSQMAIRDEVAALKRARIIDAAVELFYEKGYEQTTLEAVAERLGVTKPFIYSHFSSKAELLADICSRGIGAASAAMDGVLHLEAGPARKLAIFGRRFVTAVLENQKYIAVLFREEKELNPADLKKINDLRRDFDRKLTALIAEGVRAGEFRVSDPHIAALSIGGMVSWAYVWYRPGGRLTLEETAEQMAQLILAMVNVDPAIA